MADSIPQLKSDINALQKRLAVALGRVAELEAMPPQVVEVKVPMPPERVVEYRDRDVERVVERVVTVDNPDHVAEIFRLRADLAEMRDKPAEVVEVIKEVIKPVAMPPEVRIEYRDRVVEVPVERVVEREVEVMVKDPIDTIRADALASELLSAKAEILDLKAKLAIERKKKPKASEVKEVKVKVPMPAETRVEYREREVVKVERVDNPAHLAEIARLSDDLDAMRRALDLERQKPPVVEVVAVPVDRPVAMPADVRIEYRDREIDRVVYRDNPELVATIRKLQKQLRGK